MTSSPVNRSSLFTRALLSPTALALALTTAFAPIAAADRTEPSSEPNPLAPRPVPELPRPGAPRTTYRVTRLPPSTPVANKPVAPSHAGTGFAQPPTGWSSSHSTKGSYEVPVAPIDDSMNRPVIVTKDAVRAALEQARINSLTAFKWYLDSQTYPSNTYTKGALNVWRDAEGHFCAAATIIRISGRLAISEEVANTDNNLRLINVKDGALMDWILTSGLTQQEIDRIQRPFIGVRPDGPRHVIVADNVDPKKKTAETARLLKLYRTIYAGLQKNNKASLEVAVNRLMAHPDLARDFLDGTLASRDLR